MLVDILGGQTRSRKEFVMGQMVLQERGRKDLERKREVGTSALHSLSRPNYGRDRYLAATTTAASKGLHTAD